MSFSKDKITGYFTATFVFLLLVILPLVYSNYTVDINLVPQFLFLSLVCLVGLICFYLFGIHSSFSFYSKPLYIALGLYLLFSGVSLINAVNPNEGIFELLKIGSWIILVIILTQLSVNNFDYKNAALKSFTIASFVLGFIGLMQVTGIAFTEVPGNAIPYGTLANRNIFIPSLLLTLPFAVYELWISQNKIWKLFSIVSVLINVVVILFGHMRTAWLAVFIAVLVSGFLLAFFNKKLKFDLPLTIIKRLRLLLTLMLLGLIVAFIFVRINSSKVRSEKVQLLSTTSTDERTAVWKNSLHMFVDHPLTGVGIGNWKIMLPNYGLSAMPPEVQKGDMHFQRPENDFIWVFAETGIFGGIAYCLIFAFAIYFLIKNISLMENKNEKHFMFLVLVALILYIVIAFFGFPRERAFLSVELAVILSFIFASHQEQKRKVNINTLIFILLMIACVYKGSKLYAGEKRTAKIIEARASNQQSLVLDHAQKTIDEGYLMDNTSTPILFYLGVALFAKQDIDGAITAFEDARKLHPYHLHVLNNLATCYSIKGRHNEAISIMNEALRISPDFQEALINLSAEHYNAGRFKQACNYFLKAKSDNKTAIYFTLDKLISKRINDSILTISNTFLQIGDLDKAEAILTKCRHSNKLEACTKLKVAIRKARQKLKQQSGK